MSQTIASRREVVVRLARPAVSFRDGLARTAEWIGRNLHHFRPMQYAR